MCSIMVKTCEVKVDKETYTVDYDTDEYEKLICEVSVSAKEGRNAFKCIHCKAKFTSKQRLNCHRLNGCSRAFDIDGKPLKLKLYPSVTSGGAAEVKDILEKNNLHVRNTFKCIHCNKECLSKQRLNYHCRMGCPGVLDINGKPLQLKLLPSVPSGGAVEVRDILEKNNLHVRNTFKCNHCNKECLSKQRLNYHCRMRCPGVLDINGQPLQLKLLPSVPSGGAAEVRDILEKQNLHRVCELEESDQLATSGEDVLHGSPLQLPCKDGSELPDAACVTPIVEKEHPESHEVSAEFMDISEKNNFHGAREPEESDQPAGFGEDVIPHGSPLQLLCKDGSELPEALCVTPIVYKEHPDSHEVSFLVMDGLSFSPAFVYQEELDKEGLSIYQEKWLFDFLRQKANKALWVVSVTKLEDCIPTIAPIAYTHLTACGRLDYPKIYSVIIDRIVENPYLLAGNTRMVQIEDVPATIWAPMTGLDIAGMRVTNIIIMGRHEDCTIFGEAEGERWISWGEKGCLEGDSKGLSLWEHKKYVEWVQDLLWNCNKLILSRRELIPKSVVPSCCPSVSNALDGCQDMHNLKEVLVTQQAKGKDSSERNKKSFANVPPGGGEGRDRRFGNSGGNEDVINITKQQQVSLPHLRLNLPVQLIFCLQ